MNERKKAHSLSKCRTHRLDRFLKNHNENLARLTSSAIVEFASSEGATVIVMENLSITGKVKGSKKERLHLWRKKDVSKRVEALAHRKGMRFSTVWAAGTSKLTGERCVSQQYMPVEHQSMPLMVRVR